MELGSTGKIGKTLKALEEKKRKKDRWFIGSKLNIECVGLL